MSVSAAQLQANVTVTGADQAVNILTEIGRVVDGLIGKFAEMPAFNIGESFAGVAESMSGITGVGQEVASTLATATTEAVDFTEAIAGIGGVTEEASSGLTAASSSVSTFKDSLSMISGSLQELASNVGGVISGRLGLLASSIQNLASGPIDSLVSRLQDLSSTVSDVASSAFNAFMSRVQDLGSSISDVVSGPLGAFADGIQRVSSSISDAASGAMDNLVSRVQQVGSSISDVVSGPLNSLVSGVQQIGSTIGDAVSGPLGAFTDGVQRVGSTIGDAVSGPFNSFISSIQSFGADITEAATGPLADLIHGIQSLSSAIGEAASGPLDSFKAGIQSAASSMGEMVARTLTSSEGIEGFKQGISGAVSGMQNFIGGIGDAASGMMDFVSNLGMGIMNLQILGQTAVSVAEDLLGPAASAETMQTAFTTLLGSTKAATEEMQKLDAFASKTPFKTMDIDQAASQLIGFGINAKDVVPDLTAMGDALSAVGKGSTANLDSVVNIFGKIQTQGKLTTGIMTQLSAHGINAWAILEQQTGKTKEQLTKMVSAGLIPAKDAMEMLTTGIEKNPLYAGGMAKQSATMTGLISTLKSNWDQMLASFGSPILKGLEPVINNLGNALSSQGFKDFAGSVGQKVADAFKSIGDFVTKNDIGGKIEALGQNLGKFFNNPNIQKFAGLIGQDLVNGFKTFMNAVSSPAFGTFMAHVGTFVGGALLTLHTVLTNVATAAQKTAKFFQDNQVAMALLEGVLASAAIIIGVGMVAAFVAWAIAAGAAAIATIAATWPILLIGAIIALVIAGIILAIQHWGEISKWLTGVWTAVSDWFGGLFGKIGAWFGGIGQWFQDRFTEAKNGVMSAIGGIGQWFQDRFHDITNAFANIGGWFHDKFTEVYNKIKDIIGNLGPEAAGWASDMINGFINKIRDLIGNVGKVAGEVAQKIRDFLHFSKPDIGPLADVDTWMPHFGDLLSSGLNDQIKKVSASSLKLASSMSLHLNPVLGAGVGIPAGVTGIPSSITNSPPTIVINYLPPDINLDGQKITSNTMNRTIKSVRTSGPIRSNIA